MEAFARAYRQEYERFPQTSVEGQNYFHFGNKSFESVDAEILYCMVRRFKPQRIIEIGSGYTTLLTAQALQENKAREGQECLEFTAIEPYPPKVLCAPAAYPVTIVDKQLQEVDINVFKQLQKNDILFIDSTHVAKAGSDVIYEFHEIIPRLNPGVIIHLHDIFLPYEYPREWIVDRHRFWNEQYLLQSFLCANHDFQILFSCSMMAAYHKEALAEYIPSFEKGVTQPASFWMQRVNQS